MWLESRKQLCQNQISFGAKLRPVLWEILLNTNSRDDRTSPNYRLWPWIEEKIKGDQAAATESDPTVELYNINSPWKNTLMIISISLQKMIWGILYQFYRCWSFFTKTDMIIQSFWISLLLTPIAELNNQDSKVLYSSKIEV